MSRGGNLGESGRGYTRSPEIADGFGDGVGYCCSWLVFLPFTQSELKIAVEESSMALIDDF